MNIQPDDIEALIFDFHEGNLSALEKSELLNFIHLYPEYEKDFALWAQSYVPTNNSVDEYGLTKILLHESIKPWYKKPLTYVGAPLLLALFLSLSVAVFNTPNKQNEPIYTKPKETINIAHQVSESKKIETSITKILRSSKSQNYTKKTPKILTIKDTVEITKTTSASIIENDTLNSKNVVIDNTEVSTTKTSTKKRKSNFSIPPSGSFIPTNPNF